MRPLAIPVAFVLTLAALALAAPGESPADTGVPTVAVPGDTAVEQLEAVDPSLAAEFALWDPAERSLEEREDLQLVADWILDPLWDTGAPGRAVRAD